LTGFGFFDLALTGLALTGLAFTGLALTGLRTTGLISVGWPAAADGAGEAGLKCARQPAESRALLRIMQAVTRSTSGISGPQN